MIRENIKSTMMILVILVISGLVLVDGECQTDDGPIKNCCCLGYGNKCIVILPLEEEDGLATNSTL